MATPLGNPGDLSPRARGILGAADMILAEDTRRSGLLLAACGIEARRFVSLHDHNEKARLPGIVRELQAGAEAALISDAGMPVVSDPGYQLVKACREAGIAVSPVPGPSAPLAALAASGLPPLPFVFLGFAPRSRGDIRKFFAPYTALEATLIFFERKDRLAATLETLHPVLGTRHGCVAREMTKTYEEFIPFTLDGTVGARFRETELLGEITVVLGPPLTAARATEQETLAAIDEARRDHPAAKPKEIARIAQAGAAGWSVAAIYQLMQDAK